MTDGKFHNLSSYDIPESSKTPRSATDKTLVNPTDASDDHKPSNTKNSNNGPSRFGDTTSTSVAGHVDPKSQTSALQMVLGMGRTIMGSPSNIGGAIKNSNIGRKS